MENDICGVISCILNELSSKDVGSNSNTRKKKAREFIRITSEKVLKNTTSSAIRTLFSLVIDLFNNKASVDSELLKIFSQFSAVVMCNELTSNCLPDFEEWLQEKRIKVPEIGYVRPRDKAYAANKEPDRDSFDSIPPRIQPQKNPEPNPFLKNQPQKNPDVFDYQKGLASPIKEPEINKDLPPIIPRKIPEPNPLNLSQLIDEPTGTVQCWKVTVNGCPEDLRPCVETHNQFLFFLKGSWPKYIGSEVEGYPPPELLIPGFDSVLVFDLENSNLVLWESPSKTGACKVQIRETIITNSEKILMGVSNFEFRIGTDDELIIKVTTPNFPSTEFSIEPSEQASLIGRSQKNRLCLHYDQKMSKVHASISFKNDKWILQDRGSRNKTWKYLHTSETLYKRNTCSRKVVFDLSPENSPCQFCFNELFFICEKTHTH